MLHNLILRKSHQRSFARLHGGRVTGAHLVPNPADQTMAALPLARIGRRTALLPVEFNHHTVLGVIALRWSMRFIGFRLLHCTAAHRLRSRRAWTAASLRSISSFGVSNRSSVWLGFLYLVLPPRGRSSRLWRPRLTIAVGAVRPVISDQPSGRLATKNTVLYSRSIQSQTACTGGNGYSGWHDWSSLGGAQGGPSFSSHSQEANPVRCKVA